MLLPEINNREIPSTSRHLCAFFSPSLYSLGNRYNDASAKLRMQNINCLQNASRFPETALLLLTIISVQWFYARSASHCNQHETRAGESFKYFAVLYSIRHHQRVDTFIKPYIKNLKITLQSTGLYSILHYYLWKSRKKLTHQIPVDSINQ